MTQDEMGSESARSPQTSRFPQQQGTVSFPKGLPNLSGVQGTRRRVAIVLCIAGLILAPLAVILFLVGANETPHAAIPAAVFFQVVFMFALFGGVDPDHIPCKGPRAEVRFFSFAGFKYDAYRATDPFPYPDHHERDRERIRAFTIELSSGCAIGNLAEFHRSRAGGRARPRLSADRSA